MKNSNNFYYCDADACTNTNNANGYGSETDIDIPADGSTNFTVGKWTAHNIATLNDCTAGDNWKLVTDANNATGGTVVYDATVPGGTDCELLTPSFAALKTKS